MSSRAVLMLDLLPIEHSTRPRKMATVLAKGSDVTYVSLANAGRSGMSTAPGEKILNGFRAVAVPIPTLREDRRLWASLRNVAAYLVGLRRMFREARRIPADLIVVSSPVLLPFAHRLAKRRGSRVVFDGRERPASVAQRASLASWLARVEPFIYRVYARRTFGVIAAAPTHAAEYQSYGFRRAHVLFNVPNVEPTPFSPPTTAPLTVGLIGSLYPGRGVLELIAGVASARSRGVNVGLRLAGFASEEFMREIDQAAVPLRAVGAFEFLGPLPYDQVRGFYQSISIGAVLYEATDRAQDSLSNKLFECVASGRGVLASTLPEMRLLVEEMGLGRCVDVSGEAIAAALVQLANSPEEIGRFCESAVSATRDRFNWPTQERELLAFLG